MLDKYKPVVVYAFGIVFVSVRLRYQMPVVLLRLWQKIMVHGSMVKQWMIRKKRGEKLSAK